MDLEGIRLLLQVVELGSVHRAAHQMRVSRSMLRRRLNDLENDAGCRLLVTSAAGVSLTPAGAVIVNEGREVLDRAARMLASARATTSRPDGVLRIIVPAGMPTAPRAQMMQLLRASSPGLRVHELESADPLSRLHEPFDLMFHYGPPPSHGQWFSRVVRSTRLAPVASQAYLDAHGRPETLDDLARHTLLSWQRPGSDPRAWPCIGGGDFAVEPYTASNNPVLLHLAAQDGVGILLGSDDPVFMTTSTPLVRVLDDLIGEEVALRVLSPSPTNVDPRLRAPLEAMRATLDSLTTS